MENDSTIRLKDLLTPETVRLQVKVADTMDTVQKAGELLVATGSAEERYIEAMKESLRTNGPYMVIVPGLALLHARPQDGVKKLCMSLVTLANPIDFGNEDNDPVRLAFALGAVDNNKHLEAMAALANLMQDESVLDKLATSTSIDDVMSIISKEG
jgi:Phosphotransferase system mannitol/fructose-specific IIA domain (Ntr-type)